jgi:HK97 family phage major capsid protein
MTKPFQNMNNHFRKTKDDEKVYDLGKIIRAMADPSSNEDIGYEIEVSQEISRMRGQKPGGIFVPLDAIEKRGLVVGTPTAGGNLVATELHANRLINMLRPVSIVSNLGAQTLSGLVGNVQIPRQTSAATSYWVAEGGSPTASQQALDQVPMTAKTLGANTAISRKMLLQSSVDISAFVANDLRASIGQELDRVVLCGTGSNNQPTGILNGASDVYAIDTNGGALGWSDVVNLESILGADNADQGTLAYVTTKQARAKMNQTFLTQYSEKTLWMNNPTGQMPGEGIVNGHRAVATNLLPSDLTKGTGTDLSAMIFGNWSDVIIGQWGMGIDLILDPYKYSTSGGLQISAFIDVDVCIRHPESFVVVKDIATA